MKLKGFSLQQVNTYAIFNIHDVYKKISIFPYVLMQHREWSAMYTQALKEDENFMMLREIFSKFATGCNEEFFSQTSYLTSFFVLSTEGNNFTLTNLSSSMFNIVIINFHVYTHT